MFLNFNYCTNASTSHLQARSFLVFFFSFVWTIIEFIMERSLKRRNSFVLFSTLAARTLGWLVRWFLLTSFNLFYTLLSSFWVGGFTPFLPFFFSFFCNPRRKSSVFFRREKVRMTNKIFNVIIRFAAVPERFVYFFKELTSRGGKRKTTKK